MGLRRARVACRRRCSDGESLPRSAVQARCPQAGQLPRGPEEGRQDQPVQPGGALVPWAVHGGGSSAAWGIARTLPGGGTGREEDCQCPHALARPRELPWISWLGSPAPAAGHGRRSTGFGPPARPSPGIGGERRGPGGPAGGFLAPAGGWSSPGGTVGPVAARGPLGQPPLPDRLCAGLPSPVAVGGLVLGWARAGLAAVRRAAAAGPVPGAAWPGRSTVPAGQGGDWSHPPPDIWPPL